MILPYCIVADLDPISSQESTQISSGSFLPFFAGMKSMMVLTKTEQAGVPEENVVSRNIHHL